MILKANPATVNTPSAHVNAQCGCLQSGFPQTHMFSTEFLIYSTQSFSYCIQSCSRQYQNLEKTFIRKQTFFNHTEKSQSKLGLEVRMLPYPMGLPRLKGWAQTLPPAVTILITMLWPILGSVFQAASPHTQFLRNFNIHKTF